jgi:hypothetical protein
VKKALVVLLVLLPSLVYAQNQNVASFAIRYDVDSGTATYCRMEGANGSPWGAPNQAIGRIKTTGLTTTVDEETAAQAPFTGLAAGDVLLINAGLVQYVRSIVTYTSASQVVVDEALNIAGASFSWYKLSCGTGITAGWIDVAPGTDKTLTVQYNAGNLTGGLDVLWQCKAAGPDAQPIQVYPASGVMNLPTAGAAIGTGLVIYEQWSSCRVGLAFHTADPADVTPEMVTAHILQRTR